MDQIPQFEITTYDFAAGNPRDWVFPYNYHYLYILENGSSAYIGETNDIWVRSLRHRTKTDACYPYHFERIHVITGERISGTPAQHYEALLILLMRIDGKFRICNTAPGSRTFYADRNLFELGFDQLWVKLAAKGLVTTRTFQAILNTTEYKYSPFTALTPAQQQTMDCAVNALLCSDSQRQRNASRSRPILIEGDAGTGKTVVAASLFYYLKEHPIPGKEKVALVYANPATRKEIQSVFRCVPGGYAKDVICPVEVTKSHYDIILCDEAQRLRQNKNLGMYTTHFRKGNQRLGLDAHCNELDWLLENSDNQILFYDSKQIAAPADLPQAQFQLRLDIEHGGTRPVALTEQHRIRAGDQYVPYVYDVLFQRSPTPMRFRDYEFKLFRSFRAMYDALFQRDAQMGLCRLCSGYAWKWISKNDPEQPDIVLDGINIRWNQQTGGWLRNPDAKREMGSIYSVVGLDLNYAGVVIGPDLYYDRSDGTIKVNKQRFFDNKVKSGVSGEALAQYVRNTYAVLLTRGIYGTFVYVCDDALREYLASYLETDAD